MKTRHLLVWLFLFAPLFSRAAPAPQSQGDDSMRERAESESKFTEGQKLSIPSDARVEGMLSLKDPRDEAVTRHWKYLLHLSIQEFHPRGQAESDYQNSFDMNQSGQTLMPSLAVGFIHPAWNNSLWTLSWGAEAQLGYATQESKTDLVNDARINSLLVDAHPFLLLGRKDVKWMELSLGFEYGNLSYVQTSSNDTMTFSKHGAFTGWTAGLNFNLSRSWALTTEFSQRKMSDNEQIDIQQNNLELGTRVTW